MTGRIIIVSAKADLPNDGEDLAVAIARAVADTAGWHAVELRDLTCTVTRADRVESCDQPRADWPMRAHITACVLLVIGFAAGQIV